MQLDSTQLVSGKSGAIQFAQPAVSATGRRAKNGKIAAMITEEIDFYDY